MSDQRTTSFWSLPPEIRLTILSFTPLVTPNGIALVRDGRLTTRVPYKSDDGHKHWPTCDCDYCAKPFAGLNILSVQNKAFRYDAHCILFSKNRLDLTRHPAASLRFLREKQPWIRHVRDVRFTFDIMQIDRWITNGVHLIRNNVDRPRPWATSPPSLDRAWVEMADFIRGNIPLHTLSITLDAWELGRNNYLVSATNELCVPNVLDSYKAIIEPYKGWGEHGLRHFYVLWALFLEYEDQAKEEVMGTNYKPLGKVSPDSRFF